MVTSKQRKIVWDNIAKEYLKNSLRYIKNDSPKNAAQVKDLINNTIKEIPSHPEKYPADKYRLNNEGNYRALEIYYFRISYFIGDDEIRIVRVRNTHQIPLAY